jgi:hypothetical protein
MIDASPHPDRRADFRGAGSARPRPAAGALLLAALLLLLPACDPGSGDVDPCEGVTCSFAGVCITDGIAPYCSCDRGFHPVGVVCTPNDPDNPCDGVSCNDRGRCRVEGGFPVCDCDPGHEPDESGLLCLPIAAPDADVDAEPDGEADIGPDAADAPDTDTSADAPDDATIPDADAPDDAPDVLDTDDAGDAPEDDAGGCRSAADCDDRVFCNGAEVCGAGGVCEPGVSPCGLPCERCNEASASCDVLPAYCRIDGVCRSTGETNPANPCQSCQPAVRRTAWSAKPFGAVCDDGDTCTGDGVCDGAGRCTPGAPLAPGAPAPAWPPNGALTGSHRAPASFGVLRPMLRWRPPPGDGCGVPTYQVQVDGSCTTAGFASCAFPSPEATASEVAGESWRPAADLPVGTTPPVGRRYYWRVRACRGTGADACSPWSPVRYLDVGRAPSDFNGDGYSDLAVGAPFRNGTAASEGAVLVFHGGASGISSAPATTLPNPDGQADARFGSAVGWAGDVNADGFADLIVGAPWQDNPTFNEGNAFVYHGSASGLPVAPTTRLEVAPGQERAYFGTSVAGTGDVDADGFADVLVGAPSYDSGTADEGAAFWFRGDAAGVSAAPSRILDNPDNQANAHFGQALAAGGDINGDGYADVMVAAPDQDAGAADEGNVFVYHGGPAGIPALPAATVDNPDDQANGHFGHALAGAGDLDGDTYADVAIGAPDQDAEAGDGAGKLFLLRGSRTGLASVAFQVLADPGPQAGARFGSAVAGVADLNGDGRPDLIVGAETRNAGATDEGNGFTFHGDGTGLASAPAATLDNPDNQASGGFGAAVAAAGDVNGDGYADLAVGAPAQTAATRTNAGKAFVYHGRSAGVAAIPDRALQEPTPQGGARFGTTLAIRSSRTAPGRPVAGYPGSGDPRPQPRKRSSIASNGCWALVPPASPAVRRRSRDQDRVRRTS